MSVVAYATRISRVFYLAAICGSVAFADTSSEPFCPAPASEQALLTLNAPRHIVLKSLGTEAPDPQPKSENKPSDTAPSQVSSLNNDDTSSARNAASPEPFNQPTKVVPSGETPAKWTELQSRILNDEKILVTCLSADKQCSPAAKLFLSLVELGRKHEGRAQLGWINRAVNLSVRPMSDWAQYGYADYWASPLQTLTSRAGDCEDYAILKYVVLRHLGMAAADLRLVIVRDTSLEAQHAILAVRLKKKWVILDNRTMAMLNAEEASHYEPLFVMNDGGVKIISAILARR